MKDFERALNRSPTTKMPATLYRMYAQSDLMFEDDAAANKALAMAEEHLKEAADPSQKTASSGGIGSKATSSFPSKLVISAPKKLLDQVGAGKIPYADFRRQATVDYFGFSDKSTN